MSRDMDTSHSPHATKIILLKVENLISGLGGIVFLWASSLFLSLIFISYIFSSSTPLKDNLDASANGHFQRPQTNDERYCNLFDGRWVADQDGPLYSNFSCPTIPLNRNCFFNGRKDRDFLYWRWKPEECELPRFDSKAFFSIVKGKTMAFIGDSLARNQMDSLLCILSMEETPINAYEGVENKTGTSHFPHHNFTLMLINSKFLVHATQETTNFSFTGRFHLYLDQLDTKWTQKLSVIDIAIFSDSQWFIRPHYLYLSGNLIGCIYCRQPNVTNFSAGFAVGKAFQAVFKHVNERREGVLVFLRTFSPSHFEHGSWHDGGFCNRTRGFTVEEMKVIERDDWEFRNIQVQEIEGAKRYGTKKGNRFEIIDVTRAMLMRPDGHPGEFWGNKWLKGHNDCLHWCLPGPIDTWNELLLQMF